MGRHSKDRIRRAKTKLYHSARYRCIWRKTDQQLRLRWKNPVVAAAVDQWFQDWIDILREEFERQDGPNEDEEATLRRIEKAVEEVYKTLATWEAHRREEKARHEKTKEK